MTYTHLTTDELATIYSFWKLDKKAYRVAPALHRSAETVYRIYRFLDVGGTIIDNGIIDGTNNIVGVSPFN